MSHQYCVTIGYEALTTARTVLALDLQHCLGKRHGYLGSYWRDRARETIDALRALRRAR